jgi:hypothetical protein
LADSGRSALELAGDEADGSSRRTGRRHQIHPWRLYRQTAGRDYLVEDLPCDEVIQSASESGSLQRCEAAEYGG